MSRRPALLPVPLSLLALLGTGCALLPARTDAPSVPGVVVWRGEVRVDRDVTFPRGTRLVLEPGTVVRFAFRDDDGDGWGDAALSVQGDLIARGTPAQPVVFTSEAQPAEPGQWGELRIDYGSFDLEHVVLEGSTRGIHTHFTKGRLESSIFRRNVDGTRFGESTVSVSDCLFSLHTGKAYNARLCRNVVRGNVFRQNRNALFLFDADDGSTFEGNVLRDNQTSFRLGDFFRGTVQALGNDWGGPLPVGEEETLTGTDPADGTALVATQASVGEAGPRGWPLWQEAWKTDTGGFADAGPTLTDEGVYATSWSGAALRLGFLDGSALARHRFPDPVDASLVPGPGILATQCWDRSLYLLRRGSLDVLDSAVSPPSPADDHRQASPAFDGDTLFAATWAGTVRAYRTGAGRLEPLWSFDAPGPFRADLTLAGALLLAPCQDGTLYALSPVDGRPQWTYSAGAPLVSAAASDGVSAFFADRVGVLHAVDLASGRARWTLALAGPAWYAPPLLHEDVLYQGDDAGRLWAVEAATGRALWSRPLGAAIRSRPAWVADGLLAVGTEGGRLVLLDAATGFEHDTVQTGGPVFSSPAAAGHRVFVGGRDGFVRALDVAERQP